MSKTRKKMRRDKFLTGFGDRVLKVVAQIPRGKTLTYKDVARRAGSSKAARAVGNILHSYDTKTYTIPCHRVIRSDGKIGGYRWGKKKKQKMLEKEGIKISNSRS